MFRKWVVVALNIIIGLAVLWLFGLNALHAARSVGNGELLQVIISSVGMVANLWALLLLFGCEGFKHTKKTAKRRSQHPCDDG